MEHPYTNQEKAKAVIAADDFIMFGENTANGVSVLDSGVIISRNGNMVTVQHDDNSGEPVILTYNLDNITLYRDKDWEDNV